jgi:CubicO group peptidase (beta-lactamase class C family)
MACNDTQSESLALEDRAREKRAQHAIEAPMARAPGKRAAYCANSIHLAAAAVAEARNVWLPELFGARIAAPLGIQRYYFNLAPVASADAAALSDGKGYLGGGIHLTPRDQLKLGQVMLDGGVWHDQRILSKGWVTESLAPHSEIRQSSYGYGWWRQQLTFDGRDVEVFFGSGNGGQFVIGIPEMEVVVQFSGGNYDDYPTWSRSLTELVPGYILPAAAR